MTSVGVAIIGSGNIGTDLMMKITKRKGPLDLKAMIGIDPQSDGLARARSLGVSTSDKGIEGLVEMDAFDDIDIVFDATSASAHRTHHETLSRHGKQLVDLTPAAIGPYIVPVVNIEDHLAANGLLP